MSRARQRGVAVITAVLLVAMATVLATRIGTRSAVDLRRAANLMAQEQGFQVALGAEAWAAEILRQDAESNQEDTLAETWATPLPPLPVDGGSVEGQVEDMQGRFNLNNLVKPDGTPDTVAVEQLQRLLERLQLETKWAQVLVDWIDPDTIRSYPDGAEDGEYLLQQPTYRAANTYVTSTSELMALPEFGVDRYRRLAPYVAALPTGTKLNACTASGFVLDSLAPDVTEFGTDPQQLLRNREKGCFPTVLDLAAALGDTQWQAVKDRIEQKTSWFRVTTRVAIGPTQLTLYSLLERNPGGASRPVLRSFGTD